MTDDFRQSFFIIFLDKFVDGSFGQTEQTAPYHSADRIEHQPSASPADCQTAAHTRQFKPGADPLGHA